MVYYDPIIHGGPGSGRYPLGSGDRPYQHRGGVGGFLARRRQRKMEAKMAQAMKRAAAQKVEKERAQMTEEQLIAAREMAKKRAITSGNATDVLRFRGGISNPELEIAVRRLELERRLQTYAMDELDAGVKRFDHFMNNVKTYSNWVNTGIDVWNNFAAIYNTMNPDGGVRSVNKGGGKKG